MNDTNVRMEETEILLNQAINSISYPAVFRANLNAFISSARSITWIMQKEFNSKSGFNAWYKTKQEDMARDDIFELFKNLRNMSIKERPVARNGKLTTKLDMTIGSNQEVIIPLFKMGENGEIIIKNNTPITINGKPSFETKPNTNISYYFEKRPNNDALELSQSYLNKLRDIVTQCYSKFS